ncbi:hypothetical protein EVAR_23609_1 [Eumeta japonica]|uniref:Uncharacterized protein n=1 Tax=Eumeta variegata TaxID=151549 RepID=A0A4C1X1C5_EUMVA|nr:hypothetical protein EVAR_23609_1 [Eumeta japonica]
MCTTNGNIYPHTFPTLWLLAHLYQAPSFRNTAHARGVIFLPTAYALTQSVGAQAKEVMNNNSVSIILANSSNQLCERVEHGPAGPSRKEPSGPGRVTRAFHCDVIARNY